MRRLCHFRIRLRGWDCTRGYDLFFCVCTCVGLHLVRVHSQLEKKEFRLHPGKEDTRSSRTQTVLEMFETRIFISSLYYHVPGIHFFKEFFSFPYPVLTITFSLPTKGASR